VFDFKRAIKLVRQERPFKLEREEYPTLYSVVIIQTDSKVWINDSDKDSCLLKPDG